MYRMEGKNCISHQPLLCESPISRIFMSLLYKLDFLALQKTAARVLHGIVTWVWHRLDIPLSRFSSTAMTSLCKLTLRGLQV